MLRVSAVRHHYIGILTYYFYLFKDVFSKLKGAKERSNAEESKEYPLVDWIPPRLHLLHLC